MGLNESLRSEELSFALAFERRIIEAFDKYKGTNIDKGVMAGEINGYCAAAEAESRNFKYDPAKKIIRDLIEKYRQD